jgi:hypothetical protein
LFGSWFMVLVPLFWFRYVSVCKLFQMIGWHVVNRGRNVVYLLQKVKSPPSLLVMEITSF